MAKLIKIPIFAVLSTWIFNLLSNIALAQCDQNSVAGGVNCAGNTFTLNSLTGSNGIVTDVVNAMIYATGILAVIFIIIGGVRYIVSQGDEKSVKSAKDTVLYAIIGLILAILAFAIVNFVLKAFL